MLQSWMPGEVRCDGGAAQATVVRRPYSALTWAIREGSSRDDQSIIYHFRIDADGRPLSIVKSTPGYTSFGEDIGPSLAASRFAARAQTGCSVTYTARRLALTDAPVEDLMSYSITPTSGALPREGWARILSPETPCLAAPRPAPLIRVLPDFRNVPATAGVKDWTMIGYDQDAEGRPVGVRRITGTGNAALDRASVTAMKRSRFTGEARTGCLYPFWRSAGKMAAPEMPEPEPMRPAMSTCPDHGAWATKPVLSYPEAFRRRSIEGWAVIAFDVAPWGETGNVRVLASEPAAEFGERAVQVIRSARKPSSTTGRVGCIDRVRFVMGPVEGQIAEETPGRPAPPVY